MAAHTYVADMQTINAAGVQQMVRGPAHTVQLATSAATICGQQQQAIQLTGTPTAAAAVKGATAVAVGGAGGQQTTVIQPTQTPTGQQFIVTISGESGEPQEAVLQPGTAQQVVYQTHAGTATQYVEAPPDHTIYATSNGQLQTYNDYSQAAMYTPVTGTYYQTTATGSTTQTQIAAGLGHQVGSAAAGLQGHQILAHQGGTYLVQGGMMDGDGHPFTHTTRASPATDLVTEDRMSHFDVKSLQREVQWLIDNYETAEGVSLPRSTLYNHYLRHCQEQKMDPMNPASFGKLIRSVYLGLRTRRLGTRGNSKYHYYGIRIKAASALNQYTDEQTMALRQQPGNQGKSRFKTMSHIGGSDDSAGWSQGVGADGNPTFNPSSAANQQQQQHQLFLGDASAAIPTFNQIELGPDEVLTDGITMQHLEVFEVLYKEHSEAILDIVVNLQFSLIEALWQSFWRTSPMDIEQCENDIEQRLCKESLVNVCQLKCVQRFIRESDYAFYQALVEVLIPDVLRPIPSSLTQAIRNFAKSLEGWLRSAMIGLPEEMINTKVASVSAFAQTLRRYTSLNHLAQAARAVLQNTTQINQMLADLNRVDFTNVQEQASWVCQCDDAVVHQLEQDFKRTLQQQNSLEEWADWLEGVVNRVLRPHDSSPEFPKAARQFLLKWSFYSSMVIRDLTLRSAASFGSFHLIRLLYDEYMFYLVEHKVAAATGETPIAVMGECRQFIDFGSPLVEQASEKKPMPTTPDVDTPTSVMKLESSSDTSLVSTTPQLVATTAGGVLTQPIVTTRPEAVASTTSSVGQILSGRVVNANQIACPVIAATRPLMSGGQKVVSVMTTLPTAAGQTSESNVSAAVSRMAALPTGVRLAKSPATVTVLAAASNAKPSQTIVVVPVSMGGGETQAKRIKLN